jgi:hypothetical protein
VALMSVCIQCSVDKPAADFYAHKAMAAGHVNVCKECHKQRMRVRARTNPAVQEYDRQRAKTPERREHMRAVTAKWNEKNPLAHKAHSVIHNAVRSGRIKKLPCEFCGTERVHAHHRDYSKPLEVVWLCAKCHHRLHAVFPELEGKSKVHV